MEKEHTVYFARENFRGNGRVFGIRQTDRRQHTYVIGKSGTGKTTLIKNLALQDINNGKGVAVIDPHGEFVEEVLAKIPNHRIHDVVYFNPSDMEYPIGFNILEVRDERYKHLIASDLMGIFTKIWANVWSARMEYILLNCVLALLDTPGSTLLGIPRILVDKDYRRKIVENIRDPVVRSFWVHEYENYTDRLRSEAIVPIQNKVGQFLSTPLIRNIVGQSESTINVGDLMNTEKIFLVNVSKGRIGEDNAALLGAMLITKLQLAAMERIRIPESERKDFYLYVDEFQNFATDSFASILSEARKYRLNLIIAHQYIGQLVTDTSTKVRDAVFGNVGTLICFRVGAADAEYLETEFAPEFEPQDLVGIPNRNIYLKLMVNGVTSRPFSAATLAPVELNSDPGNLDQIIAMTRKQFTRPRSEVEEGIEIWAGQLGDGGSDGVRKTKEQFPAVCSVCGTDTTVPFKPDGRRPVYCPKCLKKVESGEIAPIPEKSDAKQKQKFNPSLGSIGIEFPQKENVPPPQKQEQRKPGAEKTGQKTPQQFPDIKEGKVVIKESHKQGRISLSQLKKQDKKIPQKGPDLSGLRAALKDAMGNPGHNADATHQPPKPTISHPKTQARANVLRPGEKIKL